ncbi:four helix bundle protein [Teredinibacter turnerae]|uniref:four helix bundle protein n=1 Tax=Teredinibacter turnerae TaxID=2426 RepID=UPI0003A7CFC9|nr:four helix bundle protein [Teredinibacter turnerae]
MKFKKLDVWKESARLCVDVYKNLGTLRDYGFRDQITRSALSIPSNIAEGEERESLKDSIRFLNIAKGSTAELITQLYIRDEIGCEDEDLGKFGALRFWERFASRNALLCCASGAPLVAAAGNRLRPAGRGEKTFGFDMI